MRKRKGFVLVEVLLAAFILTTGIVFCLRSIRQAILITQRSSQLSETVYFQRDLLYLLESHQINGLETSRVEIAHENTKNTAHPLTARIEFKDLDIDLTSGQDGDVGLENLSQQSEEEENPFRELTAYIAEGNELIYEINSVYRFEEESESLQTTSRSQR